MKQRLCPHCNQPLPDLRLGVKLTPVQARVYDLVMRGGDDGITADDLYDLALCSQQWAPQATITRTKLSADPQRSTLKSHVNQINELIADAGYRIYAGPARPSIYRLVNTRRK